MQKIIREQIYRLIQQIEPFDAIEREHQDDALCWIRSGAEIFRMQKPNIPPKHLVCYTVLQDSTVNKILLMNHSGSGLLLPNGGHVNKDELPYDAAVRELKEELNYQLAPDLTSHAAPFFISQVSTVGTMASHRDVDLWYLFPGDSTIPLDASAQDFSKEFAGYRWCAFDEVLRLKLREETDSNIHRFAKKLRMKLAF